MAPARRVSTRPRHRLRPTLVQAGAARYRRTGGAWDRGTLDSSFSAIPGTAVVDGSGRLDAGPLEAGVGALAGALAATGVRRGDVVSWQMPNGAAPFLLYRA